ncbi:toxin secretion ABC transporter ATP-binding protein [Legionella sainthelensi]|uniref:Toxin secretion ABC transporter ATP-binding protein n=1 Tax=Legionella sainthelensi TaxID=28087 RepID=A0A0W0YH47_9GAMM|nr:ABC transporter transmembrane domain-containing protein [Legionella sainthelensi]KTD56280.1 toxin secretion ABC transporter ATP-binding protein [Legionella sainthelensi]VEH32028.1 toxin secretion ABC transporter ATP-binding protein [Legionella sainthelensi]
MNSIKDVLDKPTLVSIALISLVASLLTLSVPIAAQTLINLIAFGKLMQPVVTLSLIVFILMAALGALNVWQTVVLEVIQQKLMVKISLNLTNHFTRLSLDSFSTHHGPELVNRFFEVVTIKKSLASLLLYGVNLGLQLIFGLLLLLIYHPLFIIFDAFIILSILLIIFIPYRKGLESAKKECAQKHQVGAWLEELLINRFLFRFSNYNHYAILQSDKHLVSFLNARNTHFKQLIKHQIGFYLLSAFSGSILLGLGGYLVIKNQLSLGQLVAAEIVLGALIYAFKRFGVLLENYYDLVSSESKIDAVLNLPLEEIKNELDTLFLPMKTIEIRLFDEIKVSAALEKPLVVYSQNAEFCKSFAESLLGFGKKCNMDLLVNQSICNEEHRTALRQYSLLLRKPEWFAGSIYDNLVLNHKNASTKIIIEQFNQFGLAEKIMHQPNGLKTIIYDWQNEFTEFELIALMIIRAVLLQPQLLIIDRTFDGLEREKIDLLMERLLNLNNTILVLVTQTHELKEMTNCVVLP